MINPKPPYFTIITTVKNGVSDIEKTINSVLSQTFNEYEYIIIDGGSNDGTVELIEKAKNKSNKINFFREIDNGLYFALNKGIKFSSGEVVSILHAGDFFTNNNVLYNLHSFINRNCNNSLFAIQAGSRFLLSNNNHFDSFKNNNSVYIRYFFMPLNHPSLFITRNFYEKYGTFNTEFPIAADYDLVLRLFKNNIQIYFIKNVYVTIATLGLSGKNVSYKSIKEIFDVKSKYFHISISLITSLLLYFYLKFKQIKTC